MKYLFQFYRILLACLLGEVSAHVLPLPIPAGVLVSVGGIAALAWLLKLDGMPSLTGAVIILTDPLAKGIGSASHAIGTAKALGMGGTEGGDEQPRYGAGECAHGFSDSNVRQYTFEVRALATIICKGNKSDWTNE